MPGVRSAGRQVGKTAAPKSMMPSSRHADLPHGVGVAVGGTLLLVGAAVSYIPAPRAGGVNPVDVRRASIFLYWKVRVTSPPTVAVVQPADSFQVPAASTDAAMTTS